MYYKISTPDGLDRKFIKVEGDTTAEKQIAEYYYDGCEVSLWQTSNAFKDDKRRTVSIEEIRELAN